MKFLSKLFGSKPEKPQVDPSVVTAALNAENGEASQPAQVAVPDIDPTPGPAEAAILKSVKDNVAAAKETAVNIWDMDDEDSAEAQAAVEAPVKNRRRRNATRLIGFDPSDGEAADPFAQDVTQTDQAAMQFPTGWLMVVEGEGRGYVFGLTTGLNQVGRGAENSISLDFGDTAVSRKNHFAVVFDEEERKFILGHGGKSNIIRLNGKAVISNEDLSDGDKIKVGSTVLQLKTLVGDDFDWSEPENAEELDDVAIA